MRSLPRIALGVAALAAMAVPHAASADSNRMFKAAVFVERQTVAGQGTHLSIEPASTLSRGDSVVLVIPWQAPSPASGFTVTVPVPSRLAFLKSTDRAQEISADNGRTWGKLGRLSIRDGDSRRLASPTDATHLRWRISARDAASGSGRIMVRAFVR